MTSGEKWFEKWTMHEPLSGGGQGETFVVTNNVCSQSKGVLKCLRHHKVHDPKARIRMFQEVSNLKVLHGSGAKVPKVLDDNTANFEGNDPLYFVMDLIEGSTVSETVGKRVFDVVPAVTIALQLCDTLRIAVKEGIVHRDIKPENIIVRSSDPPDVVMVDFGVARQEADTNNVTDVDEAFDNKFLSLPERRGHGENKRDPRSDLSGVCAILLFCLNKCVPRDLRDSNGQPPHRRQNYTLDTVVENPIQLALLNAFFDRGFSWELDARFQSVEEFSTRLTEILKPNATLPEEDLATVAARESAILRKSDRISQVADFRQIAYKGTQGWVRQIQVIQRQLANSRFYLLQSEYQPPLGQKEFGDALHSVHTKIGINNHDDFRVIGYHFCSVGEECSVVRTIHQCVRQQQGALGFISVDEPASVVRYAGNTSPPVELVLKDLETITAKSMTELRLQVERRNKANS